MQQFRQAVFLTEKPGQESIAVNGLFFSKSTGKKQERPNYCLLHKSSLYFGQEMKYSLILVKAD